MAWTVVVTPQPSQSTNALRKHKNCEMSTWACFWFDAEFADLVGTGSSYSCIGTILLHQALKLCGAHKSHSSDSDAHLQRFWWQATKIVKFYYISYIFLLSCTDRWSVAENASSTVLIFTESLTTMRFLPPKFHCVISASSCRDSESFFRSRLWSTRCGFQ